jgi:hypothetical protein
MPYQTFADQVNRAKNLLDGLQANAEQMGKWGITPEFLVKMTDLQDRTRQLESKRNALKASAQEATAEHEQLMAQLTHQCGVAKKLVRIALPKESWPAFGFLAGEYASKEPPETPQQPPAPGPL